MDTLIENGQWKVGSQGLPLKIFDYEELLQRIRLRLSIPKSSFLHDKNFGSYLHNLNSDMSTDALNAAAFQYAQEALMEMPCVQVCYGTVQKNNVGNISKITIGLDIHGQREEVDIEYD